MKKRLFKTICFSIVMFIACVTFCSCSSQNEGDASDSSSKKMISISGSTSVGPLMEILADEYKKEKPNIEIEIQQIGSSAGIKNAISGVSEMGMSSRDLKPDELKEVKAQPIAYDGIVVITNTDNIINNLTLDQIEEIFTGDITNWIQVGGNNQPIVVVSREDGSGTRDAFQEIADFGSDELTPSAIIADGNGSIKTTVIGNKNAVGYISFEYLDDSIHGLSCNGIAPIAENVINNTYKLARPFIVVFREGQISNQASEFLNYILSDAGQKVVEENGNIRIK